MLLRGPRWGKTHLARTLAFSFGNGSNAHRSVTPTLSSFHPFLVLRIKTAFSESHVLASWYRACKSMPRAAPPTCMSHWQVARWYLAKQSQHGPQPSALVKAGISLIWQAALRVFDAR